jgi:Mitochondrial carrier protein
MYAAGYLGVVPLLRRHLQSVAGVKDIPGGPMIVSGVTAGLLATVTTQPLDTIKTRMQAFPNTQEYPQYRSISSTTQHIVATEGYKALFAGLVPRAGRIVAAVFILTGTRNTLVDALDRSRTAGHEELTLS